jgi:CRISPR-associated endoribonuclease Cas6
MGMPSSSDGLMKQEEDRTGRGLRVRAERGSDVVLVACVVSVVAESDTVLSTTQGHHAYAAFLDLVRKADPELAHWLHDKPGRKPFTVGPLRGLPRAQGSEARLAAGWRGWLRFTFLAQPVFRTFLDALLSEGFTPRVRLGAGSFLVHDVRCTPGSHPWAGYLTATDLNAKWQCDGRAEDRAEPPPRTWTFELASPTAWSLGGEGIRRIEVLPIPELFFGGLATTWNTWFGGDRFAIDQEQLRQVTERVAVSRMHLSTEVHHFPDHVQIGAVGRITYRLLGPEDPVASWLLDLLAGFAFYAGVGYRSTMGMGQVRMLKGEPFPRPQGG